MAAVSNVRSQERVTHADEVEDLHRMVEKDLSYITDRVFMQTLAAQVRARKEVEPRWLASNYSLALRQILTDHGMPIDKMPSLGRQEAVTPEQMKDMRVVKFEINPLSVHSSEGLQAIALHLQSRQGPPVDTVFVIRQRFAGVHSDWMGESPDNCIESTYVREHNEAV
ncbi:MAG TPA: hypothetical protein VLF94_04220, partial [Chlamydiales bacterium]|nr:hypothetical protein [Chlamydiales bacterium]